MIKVIRVVISCIFFGLVSPDDDRAVIQIGAGRYNCGNYDTQKVVALADVGRVFCQAQETRTKCSVHIVVLIRRDPVVVGHRIIGQINERLLQRSIVVG
jgi:hypothetical protein